MKSAMAAKHATPKRILTCPQYILLLYEITEVDCLEQIAARLIGATDRGERPWSVDHLLSTRRVCSIRISSAMLVRDSRTSSANGAFGRHERQDSDGMRPVTAASWCQSRLFCQKLTHL
jgi:hypothetical protein